MSRTEAQQRADAKYMEDKKRITIDLTMETYETVKDIAEKNGMSVMATIRRSVDDLINKECCYISDDDQKQKLQTVFHSGPTCNILNGHIGRKFIEIIVNYPSADLCIYPEYKGKPYYSIKYRENGKEYVGFGTYKIEILSQWIKEHFISVTSEPFEQQESEVIKNGQNKEQ